MKNLLTCILVFIINAGISYGITISGPNPANNGGQYTYTHDGGTVSFPLSYSFNVTGGTIISSTWNSVTVNWTSAGTGVIRLYMNYPGGGSLLATLNVTINNLKIVFTYDNSGNRTGRSVAAQKGLLASKTELSLRDNDQFPINKAKDAVLPITESLNQLNINVFPNPASGFLYVQIDGVEKGTPVSLSLVNTNGQTVSEQAGYVGVNSIDLSKVKAGTYVFLLKMGNETRRIKILKQ